jgi:hypothetical protein
MNGGMLAFELFLYWYDPAVNTVDWQFPNLWDKLAHRSIARFDDNLETTNWLLHPTAGAFHYGLTRVNGFGVLPSFGAAAASSMLYEVVFEWKEIISINDLVVTPFGGMAVGEVFFQLGNYLNSRQPRPRRLNEVTGAGEFGRNVSSATLGLPRHTNNKLDDPPAAPLVPDDNLGLSSAYAHRFDVFMGGDFVANDEGDTGAVTALGATSEIVSMPGFLRPGKFDTWFWGGNFTRLALRLSFDSSLREFDLQADAHLFGYFEQDIHAVAGGRRGHASELGFHTMLHYSERALFDRRDQYGLVHLLGPVGNWWFERGSARFRLGADVAPDFAAPLSLAYGAWTEEFGPEGTKSSLLSHGYYFAWGASAGAHASVAMNGGSLAVNARYGRYESIDGFERMQEQVTREVHMNDEILELGAALSLEPRGTPLTLRMEAAHIGRRSAMPPVTVQRSDQRLGVSLGVRF